MSPRKSKQDRDGDYQDFDFRKIALMTGSLLFLLLTAPIIYRITMKLIEQDHEQLVNSNLLAFIVTSSFCAGLLLLTNAYFKYFSNLYSDGNCHQLRVSQPQPAFLAKLFGIFSSDSRQSTNPYHAANGRRSPFYAGEDLSAGHHDNSGKRKVDPKYFKPKFIIHELMTFWGTTCTVITWGSFYIIGGTVVMSERLAQKIKAKSSKSPTKEGGTSSFIFSGTSDTKGTGQSDFSFSSAFGSCAPTANPPQSEASTRKPPFQRISSWTRRSVMSIRKKFSRTVRNNHPQLMTEPANESSSNIFFFSSPTTS